MPPLLPSIESESGIDRGIENGSAISKNSK